MIKKTLILLALSWAGSASAQLLYFDKGADVEWDEVTLSGTNLQKRVKTSDGRDAITSIPAAQVTRVDWPYPDELQQALVLILQKNYGEALKKASAVRDIHSNWKDKPGSWYYQATLYAAECHIGKGDAAESDKILTELRTAQLPSTYQKALSFVQGLEEWMKKKPGPALTKLIRVLDADDSLLAARAHLLSGEIQLANQAPKEAMEAYLQIPVFYGAQGPLMAPAELGVAKSLQALQRFPDAISALDRLIARYKDSPEAAEATKVKAEIESALVGGGGARAEDKAEGTTKPEAETPADK